MYRVNIANWVNLPLERISELKELII